MFRFTRTQKKNEIKLALTALTDTFTDLCCNLQSRNSDETYLIYLIKNPFETSVGCDGTLKNSCTRIITNFLPGENLFHLACFNSKAKMHIFHCNYTRCHDHQGELRPFALPLPGVTANRIAAKAIAIGRYAVISRTHPEQTLEIIFEASLQGEPDRRELLE